MNQPPYQPINPPQEQPPKKKRSPWLWVALGCGGFLLITACALGVPIAWVMFSRDADSDMVEAQRTSQQAQPAQAGPDCDRVSACCRDAQGVEPSVGLFCQLAAANGEPCSAQLARVRQYLTERGTAMPASCQ